MGFSIEDEGENDVEGVTGLSTGDDDFNSNILTQNTAKKRGLVVSCVIFRKNGRGREIK